MPESRQHPNVGERVGAKPCHELTTVSRLRTGLPAGSISAQHGPEVFLPASFRVRTTGSFCPRLCGDRGAVDPAVRIRVPRRCGLGGRRGS